MRNIVVLALTTAFFMSSLFGCSNNEIYPATNPDMITVNLDLVASDEARAAFSKEKLALYNAINLKQPVSHQLISKLLIEEHQKEYNLRKDKDVMIVDFNHFMDTISSVEKKNLTSIDSLISLKPAYESKLSKYHESLGHDSETQYFYKAVSVFDVQQENLLQCYSGTVLNQLVTRSLQTGVEFQAGNRVVIFEEGHVMSGFVVDGEDGFRLYGIETTASGEGIIDFGLTREIKDMEIAPIQVADASEFAVIEIYKFDLDNSHEVAIQALENAKKKYNIVSKAVPAGLSAGINSGDILNNDDSLAKVRPSLNQSPLAFGSLEITDDMKTPSKRSSLGLATRGKVSFRHPDSYQKSKFDVYRSVYKKEAIPLTGIFKQAVGLWGLQGWLKESEVKLIEGNNSSFMLMVQPNGKAKLIEVSFELVNEEYMKATKIVSSYDLVARVGNDIELEIDAIRFELESDSTKVQSEIHALALQGLQVGFVNVGSYHMTGVNFYKKSEQHVDIQLVRDFYQIEYIAELLRNSIHPQAKAVMKSEHNSYIDYEGVSSEQKVSEEFRITE